MRACALLGTRTQSNRARRLNNKICHVKTFYTHLKKYFLDTFGRLEEVLHHKGQPNIRRNAIST